MRTFLLLVSFLTTALFASPYNPWLRCPGDLSIEAEWLYFSPNTESTYFAYNSLTGRREAVELDDYHSGYRVSAAYAACGCARYVAVTWTSLKADSSTDISGTLSPTRIPPVLLPVTSATALAEHDFSYYALDGVLGQKILCTPCISLDLFAGFHYAHVLTQEEEFFFDAAATYNAREDFWGFGPQIGLHGNVPFLWGFSLVGNVSSSIVASKPRSQFDAVVDDAGFGMQNVVRWRLVPYLNLSLALNYDFTLPFLKCFNSCLPCLRGSINIGYEALTYFNALSTIRSLEAAAPGASFDDYRNVSLHGPVAAFSLYF